TLSILRSTLFPYTTLFRSNISGAWSMSEKQWFQEAVFFELNVRAYCDSDGDGNGDFRGAMTKLDYIQSLGVDCIWVQPMYPSPRSEEHTSELQSRENLVCR